MYKAIKHIELIKVKVMNLLYESTFQLKVKLLSNLSLQFLISIDSLFLINAVKSFLYTITLLLTLLLTLPQNSENV